MFTKSVLILEVFYYEEFVSRLFCNINGLDFFTLNADTFQIVKKISFTNNL